MRRHWVWLFLLAAPAASAAECTSCPPLVALPGEKLSMSRSEITFDQWDRCVADGACAPYKDDHGWGRGARPVINVSWTEARVYAGWLSAKSGLACRLPTEAEWERAAAAGTSTAYWWGDAHGTGMANCRDCNDQPIYGSTPAGSFPPNPWGLVDMNGNVWEWTEDCWQGEGACAARVIKGGSWYYYSPNATVKARAGNEAGQGSYNIGFRVACREKISQ